MKKTVVMPHKISDYIIDRAALVVALVEKAFHRSEEELLNNWEEYTSFCPPWSEHLMKAAYVLAEPVKKQLRCYGFICMWMAYHAGEWYATKTGYYEEAIKYSHDEEMRKDIQRNFDYYKRQLEQESTTGISAAARDKIEGLELLEPFFGEDKWNLHDATVIRMDYDRERGRLCVLVDTQIAQWSYDGHTHTIMFTCEDVVRMKTDLEPQNDYVDEANIYSDGNFVVLNLGAVGLTVTCSKIKVKVD